jgi:hypothetical protein
MARTSKLDKSGSECFATGIDAQDLGATCGCYAVDNAEREALAGPAPSSEHRKSFRSILHPFHFPLTSYGSIIDL